MRTQLQTNRYPLVLNNEQAIFQVSHGEENIHDFFIDKNNGLHKTKTKHFIESNTKEVEISHLMNDCIIPVFSKDNEITVSHHDFINTVYEAACIYFRGEVISSPSIRVSHVIKGRTPNAIHKPVKDLTECDKTIYYERMAFCFEVPNIVENINGKRLNLTIGGVRAYNHANLYSRKTDERFKVFIGFKNLVCCNLCISTDGYKAELKAMDREGIFKAVLELFRQYDILEDIKVIKGLQSAYLTENQFAQLVGKLRLYNYLPSQTKKLLPNILMTDTQFNIVAKSYYQDDNFRHCEDGVINMWNVYNILTGANKNSYIDNFLDRSVNATSISAGIHKALNGDSGYRWFIE